MGKKSLFMQRSLLLRVTELVQAGAVDKPVWLDVAHRIPPPKVEKISRRPPRIEFPEDRLMQSYYARHPEAKLEPVSLDSFDPPRAKRFALRQLQLMKEGLGQRAARDKVEAEYKEEEEEAARMAAESGPGLRLSSGSSSWYSTVAAVQAEEERELYAAVRRRRKARSTPEQQEM